jgi:hypothetical protein
VTLIEQYDWLINLEFLMSTEIKKNSIAISLVVAKVDGLEAGFQDGR